MLLNAAGATFPYPIYSKWFDVYHTAHPNIQINYQSIGSGGGIRQLQAGTVDFGASDGPMTDEQLAQSKVKILHFPDRSWRRSSHLQRSRRDRRFELHARRRSPEFTWDRSPSGMIRKSPRRIRASNCRATTSSSFTAPTAAAPLTFSPIFCPRRVAEWKTKVGAATSVNWPVGLGGKGNEGVSGLVKQTPGSIGYIELIYAVQNKIAYGKVQNAAGKFVKADLAGVTAAAAGAAKEMPDDFRVSITNAPGAAAYPISSFTWLLIPAQIPDAAKRRRHQGFPEMDADRQARTTTRDCPTRSCRSRSLRRR